MRFGGRLRDVDETISSTSSFNGSFAFPSLTAYQITRKGLEAGWTDAQIRAAGGGANLFTINRGIPAASINYADLGLYGEDDWRARPNMTLSLGLRFETQNGIHDHADVAPRVGLAWGLGRGKSPKTILRAGMGMFYDRISQGSLLAAERLNGCVQQSYTVPNPDFFPNLPTDIPAVGRHQAVSLGRTSARSIQTCERHIRFRGAWASSDNYQRLPPCPSLISPRTGFIRFSRATSMHPCLERIPSEIPRWACARMRATVT